MQQNLFTAQTVPTSAQSTGKTVSSTSSMLSTFKVDFPSTATPIYKLKNEELELRLKSLVQQERKLLHLILLHIKEVESRKLYLKKAYPSLFEYLVKELGYSGSAAQRRIEAARLLIALPKMTELKIAKSIQTGSLNLSQIGEVARAIKEKQKETKTFVSNHQKEELLLKVAGLNLRDTQKQVALVLDIKPKELEKTKTQKDDSVRLELMLTKAQYEKLMRCKDLSAHTRQRHRKDSSFASVLEVVMDEYLKKRPTGPGTETIADSDFGVVSAGTSAGVGVGVGVGVVDAKTKATAAPIRHAVTTDAVMTAEVNTNTDVVVAIGIKANTSTQVKARK